MKLWRSVLSKLSALCLLSALSTLEIFSIGLPADLYHGLSYSNPVDHTKCGAWTFGHFPYTTTSLCPVTEEHETEGPGQWSPWRLVTFPIKL